MHQNNTVNTDVSTFDILTDAIDETVHKKCIEQGKTSGLIYLYELYRLYVRCVTLLVTKNFIPAGNEPLAAAMKVMNCFLEHRELVMAPYPRKPIN